MAALTSASVSRWPLPNAGDAPCCPVSTRRHQVSGMQVGSLKLLGELTRSAPSQLAANLPEIVPVVAECMYDAKQQVKVCAAAPAADLQHGLSD